MGYKNNRYPTTRMMKYVWFFYFFSLLASAQNYEVDKLRLGMAQENPIIKNVSVDSKGLLWFTANRSLFRFDGFRSVDMLDAFKRDRQWLVPDKILATRTNDIIFNSHQEIFKLDLENWKLSNLNQPFLSKRQNYKCNQIHQLKSGALVFLYDSGDILFYEKGKWRRVSYLKKLGQKNARQLRANFALEIGNYLWIATSAGSLLRIDTIEPKNIKLIQLFDPDVSIELLIKGQNEGLWLEADKQGIFFFNGIDLQTKALPLDKNLFLDVHVIAQDDDRFLVMNKNKIVVVSKDLGKVVSEQKDMKWEEANLTEAVFIDNQIIVASTKGMFQMRPELEVYRRLVNTSGRTSVRGMHIFEDGAIWFQGYGGGSYIPHDGEAKAFDHFTNGYPVLPLSATQLLLGSEGDFLQVFDKTKAQIFEFILETAELKKLGTNDRFVTSLAQDEHFYYIGTYNGLWKLDKLKRSLSKFKDGKGNDVTLGLAIRHITVQDSLQLQLSTSKGYMSFLNGEILHQYPKNNEMGVYKHILTSQGVWLGTEGAGIVGFDQNHTIKHHYTKENGLVGDLVFDILPVANRLLVLTEAGISLINEKGGLLYFEQQGAFSKMEFNHGAQYYDAVRSEVYLGGIEGYLVMSDTIFNQPVKINSSLYISEVVLPSAKNKNLINNYALPYTGQQTLELDADDAMISFKFGRHVTTSHPNDFCFAQVQGNIDMGQPIAVNQPYAMVGLAAGTYSFKVKPSINSQESLVDLVLRKKDHFYKTWWFYSLMLLCIAALGYWWYRVKQDIRKKELDYRRQIAADLHDEVGAHLSTLVLEAQWFQASQESKVLKCFGKDIQFMGSQAMNALREIISIDHGSNESWGVFLKRLSSYVLKDDIVKKIPVHFKVVGQIPDGVIHPTREYHLQKIYKEVIVNILKHSKATKINIEIQFKNHVFFMSVKDNGIGFDPTGNYEGNGIRNIAMRARKLGALYAYGNKSAGTDFVLSLRLKKKPLLKGWFYFKKSK